MNNNDEIGKLLDILKAHPEFIRDIVFHSKNLQDVLGNHTTYSGPSGPVSATQFLEYLKSPEDGHPIAFCGGGTKTLYAKGTKVWVERRTMRARKKSRKKRRST